MPQSNVTIHLSAWKVNSAKLPPLEQVLLSTSFKPSLPKGRILLQTVSGGKGVACMSDENKALARRWFEEVFNAQKFDIADEITAQDAINHDPTLTDLPSGPEGDRHVVNLYHGAFPDAQITVEEQIAEGDKVVTRWT